MSVEWLKAQTTDEPKSAGSHAAMRENLDLSRFDAAPLIALIATKETSYGNDKDG
ncbi:hypothetical protein [Thalassobius vesicularis]|uniref:hypothetical protein n=1 Tax=Thalassobius vesicularis TaxID=1294297 RepID=UPI001B3B2D6D|nr:hypothetical protein [Thalassobius vesicularis]